MSAQKPSCESVMNAISVLMVVVVSFAVHQVRYLQPFCLLNGLLADRPPVNPGISDAYYCAECTRLEKDRDGCPKIVNLGASRTDLFYERRRLGQFLSFTFLSVCVY